MSWLQNNVVTRSVLVKSRSLQSVILKKSIQPVDDSDSRENVLFDYFKDQDTQDNAKSRSIFDEDILKAKTKLQTVFWTCAAVGVIAAATNGINVLFSSFTSSPTTTKIGFHVTSSLAFPVITICSYARLNATKMANADISQDLMSYMFSTFKGLYFFYNNIALMDQVDRLDKELQAFARDNLENGEFNPTEFFLEYGLECKSFLKGCTFQGTDFDCCNNETVEFLNEVGKCFSVRSVKFPHQTIPGPMGGIKIFINNNVHQYPTAMLNANPDLGLQIHISAPEDENRIEYDPIITFPRSHALIKLGLEKKELTTKCVTEKSLKYYPLYSTQDCFQECIAGLLLQSCGCIQIGTLPGNKLFNESKLCTPRFATRCTQALLQSDSVGFLWDLYKIEERCQCPLSCSQLAYTPSVSYSNIPNPGYLRASKVLPKKYINKLAPTINMPYELENATLVDIFFQKLEYRLTEEQPTFTSSQFVGTTGGQMSIFLGVRAITLIGLMYYLIQLTYHGIPIMIRKAKLRSGMVQQEVHEFVQTTGQFNAGTINNYQV